MDHEKHETHENKILYMNEVYNIQGAVFEVYREMGCGFLEAVYQECLEREFWLRDIHYEAQTDLILNYKNVPLKKIYRHDFICYGGIIIELKAVKKILNEHRAQVINYLKATGFRLGLLINFGHYPKATVERIIL